MGLQISEFAHLKGGSLLSGKTVFLIIGIPVILSIAIILLYRRWKTGKLRFESFVLATMDKKTIKEEIIKAKQYIITHYKEESLNREEVANAVGLNQNYFGVLFKAETGLTFIDYVNYYRLKQAKKLLKTSKTNISQIAYEVGFNSLTSFNRAFKRSNNFSPTDYRKIFLGP